MTDHDYTVLDLLAKKDSQLISLGFRLSQGDLLDLKHRQQIRKQQLTIERLKRGITNARADRNMWKEQTEERDDIIAALNESLKARWADITQLTEQINFLNHQAQEEVKA